MGIEAELKARVHDPARVRELLGQRAPEEAAVYFDTYFDTPDRALTRDARELRVRVIHTGTTDCTVLTYKGPAVDEASGSKPEIETTAADADALQAILAGLGFEVLIAFEKHCSNYRLAANDRTLFATLCKCLSLNGGTWRSSPSWTLRRRLARCSIRSELSSVSWEPGAQTRLPTPTLTLWQPDACDFLQFSDSSSAPASRWINDTASAP